MTRASPLALALLLAACTGEQGVIRVDLATAPGSTLLDDVQTLRLELTNPRQVVTAQRTTSGFAIDLEVEATGATGAILVDALAADGTLIANGATPAFELGAVTGRVVVYMAAPDTVSEAPSTLTPARSDVGFATLPYGAVLAGGTLATGEASDAVSIYNAYDHSLLAGLPLPAPRSGVATTAGSLGVYLFGGRDAAGTPTGTLWRFDTRTPPSGSYTDYGDKAGFERTGARLIETGTERFLVTGTPAAEISGLDGSIAARTDTASLPAPNATVVATDGVITTVLADGAQVVRCRAGTCSALALTVPSAPEVVALPGGKVGVVCGGTASVVRIDAATGTSDMVANVPSTARTACAVAATSRHLVIAGGSSAGTVVGTAEVFDATSLAPIATQPLVVPRTGAMAITLPNDQILIAGGVDATGAPVAVLELFTPRTQTRP